MAWHVAWGTRGVSAVLCCGRGHLAEGGGVPASVLPIFLVLREDEDEEDGWEDEQEDKNPFCWTGTFHSTAARRVQSARAGTGGIERDPLGCGTVVSHPPSLPIPFHPPPRILVLYQEFAKSAVTSSACSIVSRPFSSPRTQDPGTHARHSPTTHINPPRYPRGKDSIVTPYRHARWHAPRCTVPLARGVAGAAVRCSVQGGLLLCLCKLR